MGYRPKKIPQQMNLKVLKDTSGMLNIFSIREMQIKTTLRFQLKPVRIAKIENTEDSLCWRECGVRVTHLHCWWECKLVQPLWKSVWCFLRKLGNNLPQDPAI